MVLATNRAEELEHFQLAWKCEDEDLVYAFGGRNKHGDRTEYEITPIKRKRA